MQLSKLGRGYEILSYKFRARCTPDSIPIGGDFYHGILDICVQNLARLEFTRMMKLDIE